MIVYLLNQLDPESEGLLREISKHVDDDALARIAAADYGMGLEEHLVALRQIRDTGRFPQEMYWYPAEVLELIRWSEPEDPNWKPGETGVLGHWMRAFSCAALLRATREPWNYGDGLATDSTLGHLIVSLCALPVDFTIHAVRFLAWLLLHSEPEGRDQQVCAYGLGLLWFALQPSARVSDKPLISLAKWVVRRADELFERYPRGNPWGLRGMVVHCQEGLSWETVGAKLLELNLDERSPDLRVWVEVIAEQLIG
jgi:hypothetical protein